MKVSSTESSKAHPYDHIIFCCHLCAFFNKVTDGRVDVAFHPLLLRFRAPESLMARNWWISSYKACLSKLVDGGGSTHNPCFRLSLRWGSYLWFWKLFKTEKTFTGLNLERLHLSFFFLFYKNAEIKQIKFGPNFEHSIIYNILASPTTWATIWRLFLSLAIWDSQSLKLPALWSNPSQSQNNAWTPNRSRKARVGQDVLKGIAASTIPLSHKLAFAP